MRTMPPERLAEIERNHEPIDSWGYKLTVHKSVIGGFACVICELLAALREVQLQLNRFRLAKPVEGTSHSTACWIWGDDGQGLNGGPCNCNALINWHKRECDALQRRVEALEKALTPFAREAATLHSDRQQPDGTWVGHRVVNIERDDYFRAEAALRGEEAG